MLGSASGLDSEARVADREKDPKSLLIPAFCMSPHAYCTLQQPSICILLESGHFKVLTAALEIFDAEVGGIQDSCRVGGSYIQLLQDLQLNFKAINLNDQMKDS